MFRFESPAFLYLLLLIPVLTVLYWLSARRRRRTERRLADDAMLSHLSVGTSPGRRHFRFALILAVVALMALMLARPQYGLSTHKQTKQGIEVAVMLDVSNSMLAQDASPNRLQRSKRLLLSLVDALQNDRVALGIFAGEAYPQLPLTTDRGAAKLFIQTLSTGTVTSQGTNLAAALELADHSFSQQTDVGRAIVVITDAEDHLGNAAEAAAQVADNGRKIFVLGIGTAEGAPIPTAAGNLLDDEGHTVVSRLNEELAREVAQAGNGLYLHVDDDNSAQQILLDELGKLKKSSVTEAFDERNEQFPLFALAILLLLGLDFLLFDERNRWLERFHLFDRATHKS
ncbi:MAG: VWA domain-containing protein [Alloprevotella sp.]|nr:VWA domain-containing protein [Alloprevotella sp.]